MHIVAIGSAAMRHYGIDTGRPMLDLDVVGTYDDLMAWLKQQGPIRSCYPINEGKTILTRYQDGRIVEGEIAWEGTSSEQILQLTHPDSSNDQEIEHLSYADPDLLYAIKMSHRYKKNSVHFLKTMNDIHLLRSYGAMITIENESFYKLRQKETYNYGHPKLNVTKDGFFTGDGVEYKYDHDSIHLSMMHLDRPAYEMYKIPGEEVLCSKELFEQLPHLYKLYGVLEESYVLALERSQIPFGTRVKAFDSFQMALQKVCTSITSGWFREFAWENYHEVMLNYDKTYVDRFWAAVESGLVKPYTGGGSRTY